MEKEQRSVTVLGSTGSVGKSTLDLIRRSRDDYRVEALVAGSDVETLAAQARELGAAFVAVADPSKLDALRDAVAGHDIEVGAGPSAIVDAAARPSDWVMSAIVGFAGLAPTMAAIERGATVGLANKESLVAAGDVVMAQVKRCGATLLPVDSEHNAIFQVLHEEHRPAVARIVLTASGGPFRTTPVSELASKTPAEAVKHPNWSMGAKISVDSATMMNKGLEIIEAHHVFAMPPEQIEALVHPESIIHGLVEYVDGSVLAQLGTPDMRTPIAVTLAWPHRIETPSERLDLAALGSLNFEAPDLRRFPALGLAREALVAGGGTPAVLNAANEVAVAAFLSGRIGFMAIVDVVERVLEMMEPPLCQTIDDVLAIDAAARRGAEAIVEQIGTQSTVQIAGSLANA